MARAAGRPKKGSGEVGEGPVKVTVELAEKRVWIDAADHDGFDELAGWARWLMRREVKRKRQEGWVPPCERGELHPEAGTNGTPGERKVEKQR